MAPCGDVLGPHASAPFTDAYPTPLLGGVHRRVLAGDAPDLGVHYPSTGGDGDADAAWPAFGALLAAGCPEVVDALRRPPQTNEVGRSASALGGFLEVARATALPLRVLEIGASAGLNLRFDRFRYEQGGAGFGPTDATPRFVDCWPDGAPPFAVPMEVVERAGCDVDPIDVATEAGALTLCAYVWPDPPERMARLRAAIAVAREGARAPRPGRRRRVARGPPRRAPPRRRHRRVPLRHVAVPARAHPRRDHRRHSPPRAAWRRRTHRWPGCGSSRPSPP